MALTPAQKAERAALRKAKYIAERDAWVAEQLSKPEAQGPIPAEAQKVLAALAANRTKHPA